MAGPAIRIYFLIASDYPAAIRRFFSLLTVSPMLLAAEFISIWTGKAEDGGEKKREQILVHSLFSAIMNALSGRIHQRSLWGEEMSGKVMVCWLLTHVARLRKVIEVQKMSCCCTSSICIAVSQDK